MSPQLTGIIAAIATPFKGDGVDYDTFAKQVNFLIENGASALAYPMHYGESLSLRDGERNECARVMANVAKGRVPTFVNVSSAGTDLAIDAAQAAAKAGSDGIVLLAPYHWKPGPEQIVEHFVAVANAHGGKLIVYNNVEATGVAITNDILRILIDRIPNFIGLKDASFDMRTFTGFCHVARDVPRLALYTGIEYLLTSVPVGGNGCFAAAAEVAPRLTRSLYEACAAGKIAEARELQYKMHVLLARLMQVYPSTVKYAMELMGRPIGETRRPIRTLTEAEKQATKETLASLGLFESEPQGWSQATAGRRAVA
jgi:4-hydroxy-tetrahydrodipicolinate synthase